MGHSVTQKYQFPVSLLKVDNFRSQLEEKNPIFAMDPGAGRAPGNPVGPCLIKQSKNNV